MSNPLVELLKNLDESSNLIVRDLDKLKKVVFSKKSDIEGKPIKDLDRFKVIDIDKNKDNRVTIKDGQPRKEEGEEEELRPIDSHDILNKGDTKDATEVSKKIAEEAKELMEEHKRNISTRSEQSGKNYLRKLVALHESRVNWVKVLKNKIQAFKMKFTKIFTKLRLNNPVNKLGATGEKTKSYYFWLNNPISHSTSNQKDKLLAQGPARKMNEGTLILLVGLDTSGSVGFKTISSAMTEVDKIASNFDKSKFSIGGINMKGKVYFFTWDTKVFEVVEYKPKLWLEAAKKMDERYKKNNFQIKGGGGTTVSSVYEYLNEHLTVDLEKNNKFGIFNPKKEGTIKDSMVIPLKTEGSSYSALVAPFLLIISDGQFEIVNDKILGPLYANNKNSILYLIIEGTTMYCYPKNYISYKEPKV